MTDVPLTCREWTPQELANLRRWWRELYDATPVEQRQASGSTPPPATKEQT